jgi:hypothetical protein
VQRQACRIVRLRLFLSPLSTTSMRMPTHEALHLVVGNRVRFEFEPRLKAAEAGMKSGGRLLWKWAETSSPRSQYVCVCIVVRLRSAELAVFSRNSEAFSLALPGIRRLGERVPCQRLLKG